MGNMLQGVFGNEGMYGAIAGKEFKEPSYMNDPYRGGTQKELGNYFTGAAGKDWRANAYPGQINAPGNDAFNTSMRMYQSAVQQYNPERFGDIYGRYQSIADTGYMPQMQAYIDATTRAAGNEWQRNVMPGIKESTRGYGRSSATPEAIAKAGSDYYTKLAGTMAPYALQMSQQEAANRQAGIAGMGTTATQMTQQPMNLAGQGLQFGTGYRTSVEGGQEDLNRLYQDWQYRNMLPYAIQFANAGQGGYFQPQPYTPGLRNFGTTGYITGMPID